MGLLDNLNLGGVLRGVLGEAEAAALPAVLNTVLAQTQYHDLNGLVAALQKGGLNTQVQSWLGPGANLPISEDQLKAILGNAQVQEFARQLGLPRCDAQTVGAIPARHRRQSQPERHAAIEVIGCPCRTATIVHWPTGA